MQQKIESMAEKQTTIERSQEVIFRTQNTILCRLDIIERAFHVQPQNHSTPYRHRQPRFAEVDSSWPHGQNQWFDEDDYGSEWNRADNTIYSPTSYTGGPVRPFTHHHSFVAPYSGNNQHSFNSLDLPADQHSFNSLHPPADQHSFNSLHPPADQHNSHLQINQHSLDTPEPFPIKFTGNSLPSSEIDKTKLQPVETILHKFSKLHCESKIGTLAVKLAKVSIFGDQVLLKCTVMGERELPGLPAAELMELKRILFRLFPKLWGSRHEFEPLWKTCVDAIGQGCKRLRLKKP